MLSSWSRALLGAGFVVAPLLAVSVSGQQVNYNRAEQLLDWNTTLITFGDEVRPQWLLDGARFWYRNKTPNGAEFVAIDWSTVTTCRGDVESERDRPEPSFSRGEIPNLLSSSARTTAAPAAVVPAPPSRAPMSLSSVSAR